jgi:IS4 transposase
MVGFIENSLLEKSNTRMALQERRRTMLKSLVRQVHERWQVDLFCKWTKQHLRIKAFLSTSVKAVKTQICIAVCACMLIAIAKRRLYLSS